MQSFLGSLNYYSRFIEDFAISVLYELRESDFHEITRKNPKKVWSRKQTVTFARKLPLCCATSIQIDPQWWWLNYYSRFIEDFAIYASVLYELRESDFHEITRKKPKESVVEEANNDDREETPAGEDRWTRAERAFTVLKTKIAATPVLRHWGLRKVDYLGHQVSMDGLEAHPKDLQALAVLPFPSTLRAMQSFLGGLNYYSRFIEDFAIYASVLHELRESDFHEITRKKPKESVVEEPNSDDREETPAGEDRWTRAERAFTVLKTKNAATPVLRHFDPDRPSVVVVYASKWAVSAALMQEHDGVYWPVTFTSRTLKSNKINYGIVDKEVLALLRILEVCYTLLETRTIKVLTRYSTLGG
ncbi:hypothetical protein PR002_g25686 [Phytophthora rubi]|uniref:Reverse transcriptase/retrotransposon-derived protein RNase H-like domain-containing protein n=1 Tax=Phytophthora rubi TaxID=129364 RepID=A0A6A3I179_9STRA|nr:hypothetical protein PR002_g25686 [Phytophthora rubi]